MVAWDSPKEELVGIPSATRGGVLGLPHKQKPPTKGSSTLARLLSPPSSVNTQARIKTWHAQHEARACGADLG